MILASAKFTWYGVRIRQRPSGFAVANPHGRKAEREAAV
jgi:hypothetical protein